MNNRILIVAATAVGVLSGSGGTYLIMPASEPIVRPPNDTEIAAFVAANPALIPKPQAPALDIPSSDEALAAYRKAYARNPLRVGLEKPSTISIPCQPSGDQANVGDHDPGL